jgi:peptide/nickel transport system substrate-binding protein
MKLLISVVVLVSLAATVKVCFAVSEKEDSSVTVGLEADIRSIDPRFAVDANSQYLEDLINCSLVTFNQQGEIEADLAKEWKWLDDNVINFKLHTDRKFSDKSLVSAMDVMATFNYFIDDKLKSDSPRAGAFRNIKNIKISKNNDSITFVLQKPDASFVTNLVVGILPKSKANLPAITKASDHVGCGPYTLKKKGLSMIQLAKNVHYKGNNVPKNDVIKLKVVKSESTRFAKLRKGEIDLVQNTLNRETVKEIGKKYKNLKMVTRPGLRTTYLGFNMRDKLAGDVHVRRAISLAIDRDKIIKFIFGGMATPASTILTPDNSFKLQSIKPRVQNVEEAKKILTDAGYADPDGDGPEPRFKMSYKTTTDATRISIAKAIASQLRKIGIQVTVEPREWGKFKADVEAGRVQIWSLTWIGFKDPDIYRYAFGSDNFPPNGPNRGFYKNKKLDSLLTSAIRATKSDLRKTLYQRAQEIIYDDLPYVFLWHEENFAVMGKNIDGFQLYADGRLSSLTNVTKSSK